MINILFLISLFVLFPLGEVTRYQLGNGTAVSLFDIAAIINFVIVVVVSLKNKHVFFLPFTKPIGIFLLVCIVSLLVNLLKLSPSSASIAGLYILRFAAYASFYISVSILAKETKKNIPKYLVIAGLLVGIFGSIQFFLYPTLQNLYYLGWDRHWYRLFATFFDPNFAGVVLLFPLFFSLFLTLTSFKEKHPKAAIAYAGFTLFFVASVFLTFSRTALLALCGGLLVYFLRNKTSKRIIASLFALLIIGVVIVSINYKATEGTKLYRFASSEARLDSMSAAVTIFEKNPFFGVGFNAYRYAQKKYGFATGDNWQISHSGAGTDNSFLFVLATTGIIGATAFLYLIVSIGMSFSRSSLPLAAPIAASFVAVGIGSIFINALFYPAIMFLLWSCLGIMDYTSQ